VYSLWKKIHIILLSTRNLRINYVPTNKYIETCLIFSIVCTYEKLKRTPLWQTHRSNLETSLPFFYGGWPSSFGVGGQGQVCSMVLFLMMFTVDKKDDYLILITIY
jgi:hypothetical protein